MGDDRWCRREAVTAHRLASILHHPKQQVLGAEGARLIARQLQSALGETGRPHSGVHTTVPPRQPRRRVTRQVASPSARKPNV
jgi:hypothetical protein